MSKNIRKKAQKAARESKKKVKAEKAPKYEEIVDIAKEIKTEVGSLREAQEAISQATGYGKTRIYKVIKEEAPETYKELKKKGMKKTRGKDKKKRKKRS